MRELKLSNLVLMDVIMKSYGGESYPNSGVMIEFGLLMNDRTKGWNMFTFSVMKEQKGITCRL